MTDYLGLLRTLSGDRENGTSVRSQPSDMDIIETQALLMESGSLAFKAIKAGELALILAGIVAVAYCALDGMRRYNMEPAAGAEESTGDYLMAVIMRRLSEKIAACSSGNAADYTVLFNYCRHLARDFVNADFDNALECYHRWHVANGNRNTPDWKDALPDVSDCLFE